MRRHSFRQLACRVGAVGAAAALGAFGLTFAAGTASAGSITETFSSFVALNSSWTQLQLPETINTPASATQGTAFTMSVPGSSQTVPTTQSGVTVNSISNLNTIISVPANATFVASSIVTGAWTYTPGAASPPGTVASTGTYTVTYCTGPGTGCTATAPSATFLGPALTTYLEATTGTSTFAAGGTLVLPTWSANLTASGTGTINLSVDEFDTQANVVLAGTPLAAALFAYPSVVVASPTSAPAYQFQAVASVQILSPPAAPVLQPQTGHVSAGQCTTINPLAGSTDTGSGDAANPTTVLVATPPTNGTAVPNATTGIITYCNTGGTAATDTFTVTAADTLASPALRSAAVTETIDISYNQCSAGAGNATGGSTGALSSCSLHQEIVLPVTAGQIVLSQANGLPIDVLGTSFCTGGMVPGMTLNGNEQNACGAVSPLTVTNATGLDAPWILTGQVSDFNDPAAPSATCDTTATYSNHCIPGGNLGWQPAAAVSHNLVPGDVAQVTAGPVVTPPAPTAPALANPILEGDVTQPNPVVEPAPNAGLHNAPQTMCSTAAGQAGGTFICGAGLELAVPASSAEPAAGAFAGPAWQASLTVTLS
jgi:dehydratase